MRNINLLPRVPFIDKHLRLLLLGIAAVLVVGSVSMVWATIVLKHSLQGETAQIERELAATAELRSRKAADPLMQEYSAYKTIADELRLGQVDWSGHARELSQPLPADAHAAMITTDEKGLMTVAYQFAALTDATRYMAAMQRNPKLASLTVLEVVKEEVQVPLFPNLGEDGQTVGQEEQTDAPSGQDEAVEPDPREQYYEDTLGRLPVAADENDALRNELQWLLEQQFARQELGLRLPDLPAELSTDSDWRSALDADDRSAITDEEYERAKQSWESRKDNAADTPAGPGLEIPSGGGPGTPSNETIGITVYKVTLQLRWIAPAAAGGEGGTSR